MSGSFHFRRATAKDVPALAAMNQQLIRDEGHRNPMNLEQLTERMRAWLPGEYEGVLFLAQGVEAACGYALYRREAEWIYLRQFFVHAAQRRQGMGRAAIDWLKTHAWAGAPRVRLEVLTRNGLGIEFWKSTGFESYALMMELPMEATNTSAVIGQ